MDGATYVQCRAHTVAMVMYIIITVMAVYACKYYSGETPHQFKLLILLRMKNRDDIPSSLACYQPNKQQHPT